MALNRVSNLALVLFWGACFGEEVKISVAVYDYFGVPEGVREEGFRIAEKSLLRAGVTVNWGRCADPGNPAQILMNILPEAMAQRIAGNLRQLGRSITAGPGKFGSTGYVFRDRIAKVAEAWAIPEAALFGNVLAHEIGHLLLGDDSHSPAGLMRAAWAADDFKAMLRDGLMFETGQVRQLRANVERRLQAGGDAIGFCAGGGGEVTRIRVATSDRGR